MDLTNAQRAHLKMMTIRFISDPPTLRQWLSELEPAALDAWRYEILGEAYWLLDHPPTDPNRYCWNHGDKSVNFAVIVRDLTDHPIWEKVNDAFTTCCCLPLTRLRKFPVDGE